MTRKPDPPRMHLFSTLIGRYGGSRCGREILPQSARARAVLSSQVTRDPTLVDCMLCINLMEGRSRWQPGTWQTRPEDM